MKILVTKYLLTACVASLLSTALTGQETPTVTAVQSGSPGITAEPKGDSSRRVVSGTAGSIAVGRLPRFFAGIVDSQQRLTIYQIQADVRAKTELLEKQLQELRDAEMLQIEGLLSAAQRTKLDGLRSAANIRPAVQRSGKTEPKLGAQPSEVPESDAVPELETQTSEPKTSQTEPEVQP